MSTPRLFPILRRALILPTLAALAGCATAGAAHGPGALAGREPEAERGPGVQIWTTEDFGSAWRARASFRLDEDAYVIVVNVGLDGYANVIFPESPDDDGFMRGGRTYRLPSFFTGFVTNLRATDYRRFHNAAAAYDDIYDRYAGYVFIIASRRPMHFAATEAMGLWSDYRLAVHEQQLDPYVVMHDFAEKLVPGRRHDYTARYARYAAFRGGFAGGVRSTSAFCALVVAPLGYVPLSLQGFGYGYYGAAAGCGYGSGYRFVGRRLVRGIVVEPPTQPRPPQGIPDTSGRRPRGEPRTPVAERDSAERKARPSDRVRRERAVEADEEAIIDVNRETRALARRRDADDDERADLGARGRDRGYRTPSEWSRYDRRSSRRDDDRREAGRSEQPRRNEPVDYDRGSRRSSSRTGEQRSSEPRSSEPRRESPPRSEPRSEPRQETRPQPATRSEPASRPEPRGERPASKPSEPRG